MLDEKKVKVAKGKKKRKKKCSFMFLRFMLKKLEIKRS